MILNIPIEEGYISMSRAERLGSRRALSSGRGSPRRLITAYWQFHQTYRIDSMTAEQIISLLPNEFEKFKPGASK